MAKFRKKAVEIEAIQYKGWMTDEVEQFVGDSLISESRWGDEGGPVGYFIKTLEGTSYMLSKGDWIIKGVHGEFYPCKPDIFEKTYESAEGVTELEATKDLLYSMFTGWFNANDFFMWASAFGVTISEEDFHWIIKHIQKYPKDGMSACLAYVQNIEPLEAYLTDEFNEAIKELVERKQEVGSDFDYGNQYTTGGPYRTINKD